MSDEFKHVRVSTGTHLRLAHFGRLGETYDDAMERALDALGVPKADEIENGPRDVDVKAVPSDDRDVEVEEQDE